MNKGQRYKVLAFTIILLIVLLGIFKIQILLTIIDGVEKLLINCNDCSKVSEFANLYGSDKNSVEWISNYLIYYPIYLSLHFTLIQILFWQEKIAKKYLTLGLSFLLVILILGKFLSGYFNSPSLAEYFSFAFHKLVSLPFILLAIEGGRYFYSKIK